MVVWFSMTLNFALTNVPASPVAWGMFIFGILLTLAGFYPEAMKAQRVISEAVAQPSFSSVLNT